jgi:formylglycine-generating enzyme required for sulfatase activity
MAGNVEEWVADWYGRDYYGRSPDRNPQGPDTGDLRPTWGDLRVVRGGTFICNQYVVRSACRYKAIPDYWGKYAGFRVALSPDDL